jgi:hypothetical protein
MTTTIQALGYRTSDGDIHVLPRKLRRLASRVEMADRQSFGSVQAHGVPVNFILRPFFRTGEHELGEAMGVPVRPDHVAMLCVLAADGGIDRKPLTAAQVARVVEQVEGAGLLVEDLLT